LISEHFPIDVKQSVEEKTRTPILRLLVEMAVRSLEHFHTIIKSVFAKRLTEYLESLSLLIPSVEHQ